MKRILIVLAAAVLISAIAQTADAQFEGEVREIRMDTIMGIPEPTKVGVDEMRYIGLDYITGNDSLYMNYVTQIVQWDLDFHAEYELVRVDSFFMQVYGLTEVDVEGWKRMGAALLVKLEAEFPGTKMMRVRWQLWDAESEELFARGVQERPRAEWRDLGHEIANDLVYNLTGDQGIFLSKIVYCKRMGRAKEVFTADYDGSNEQQLTTTGTLNLSPTFSPDRRWIFFISYLDGRPSLYRIPADGGDAHQVAKYDGIMAAPSVSPDGNKIACVLTKDGNSEIYVLDLQGNIIKRLTRHWAIDTAPCWSPDGSMMAFASDRSGAPQIYTMDSDGLNVRRVTYKGGYNDSPIWSGKGDRLTFVSRTPRGRFDLASCDTSGADYRILTEVGQNENPHFSPDGKHIIFSSTRLGQASIFTMDITGRNQRRATNSGDCSNPSWGPNP